MLLATTTLFAFVRLAAAAPLNPTTRAPHLSKSKGFSLVAHITDVSHDLTPSVEDYFLGSTHVGAGLGLADLDARDPDPNSTYTPYYLNGTSEDINAGTTNVLNDRGSDYAWGIIVRGPEIFDYTYPDEHPVEIDVGWGSKGIGFATTAGGYPGLTGPAKGYYVVCPRYVDYVSAVVNAVRFVYEGETAPTDCPVVDIVPVCAALDGETKGGSPVDVDCLVDLSGL